MTLQEIQSSEEIMLSVDDIAPILGYKAQSIRDQAKRDVQRLGFPVCSIGNHLRVPRKSFLKFLGEEVCDEYVNKNRNRTDPIDTDL